MRLLASTLAALAPIVLSLCGCSPGAEARAPDVLVVGGPGEVFGRFNLPRALAVDRASGAFYVVDRSGRIQGFSADGHPVVEWRLPAWEFGQPVGITLEDDGNLLVSDSHYNRVLRYSPDGGELLARWGTEGTGPGQFTFGRDVVVDSAGRIYVGDYGGMNDRVQKFSRDGAFIAEWGGRGSEPGRFQRPQGMAVERDGDREHLLVADCANHRLQRFTLEGELVDVIGSVGSEPGQFRYPSSVACDAEGFLYVSEWGNNRIQRLARDGTPAGVWGGGGRAAGEFHTPWDVEVDDEGRIYVADYGNHRVQIFRWPADGVAARAPNGESALVMERGASR